MRFSALFCAALAATAVSGEARDVSWMRGSVGVSVHWTALIPAADGAKISFAEAVDGFDAEGFAAELESVSAQHLVFTLAHAWQMLPMPNAALDRIAPGRTSKRDLFGDIVRACTNRGIRVIAYYNHGCNDLWQAKRKNPAAENWIRAASCPTQIGGGDMAVFASNICSIVRDISLRYGKGVSGWWFDSAYSIDSRGPHKSLAPGDWRFPWQSLLDAARAGNPDSAVAINGGVGVNYQYCDDTDYYAGESVKLDETFEPPADGRRVDTRWICFDDRMWTFSSKRGYAQPRFPTETLRNWVGRNRAAGRMTTFNVLIDRRGRLSPAFRELKTVLTGTVSPVGSQSAAPLVRDGDTLAFMGDAITTFGQDPALESRRNVPWEECCRQDALDVREAGFAPLSQEARDDGAQEGVLQEGQAVRSYCQAITLANAAGLD